MTAATILVAICHVFRLPIWSATWKQSRRLEPFPFERTGTGDGSRDRDFSRPPPRASLLLYVSGSLRQTCRIRSGAFCRGVTPVQTWPIALASFLESDPRPSETEIPESCLGRHSASTSSRRVNSVASHHYAD